MSGTHYFMDVVETEAGWAVEILHRDGGSVYKCGPDSFNMQDAIGSIKLPKMEY